MHKRWTALLALAVGCSSWVDESSVRAKRQELVAEYDVLVIQRSHAPTTMHECRENEETCTVSPPTRTIPTVWRLLEEKFSQISFGQVDVNIYATDVISGPQLAGHNCNTADDRRSELLSATYAAGVDPNNYDHIVEHFSTDYHTENNCPNGGKGNYYDGVGGNPDPLAYDCGGSTCYFGKGISSEGGGENLSGIPDISSIELHEFMHAFTQFNNHSIALRCDESPAAYFAACPRPNPAQGSPIDILGTYGASLKLKWHGVTLWSEAPDTFNSFIVEQILESDGTSLVDNSSNDLHPTIVGGVDVAAAPIAPGAEYAVFGDGSADYIEADTTLDLATATEWTIAGVASREGSGTDGLFIFGETDNQIALYAYAHFLILRSYDGSGYPTLFDFVTPVPELFGFTIRRSDDDLDWWVNGAHAGTLDIGGETFSSTTNLTFLGWESAHGVGEWEGRFQHRGTFSEALTDLSCAKFSTLDGGMQARSALHQATNVRGILKRELGWLTTSNVHEGVGTVELRPVDEDLDEAPEGVRLIEYYHSSSDRYYFEYREAAPLPLNTFYLSHGVFAYRDEVGSYLLATEAPNSEHRAGWDVLAVGKPRLIDGGIPLFATVLSDTGNSADVRVSESPEIAVAVGTQGRAVFSIDAGESWSDLSLGSNISLFDVTVAEALGRYVAVGLQTGGSARAWHTDDLETWTAWEGGGGGLYEVTHGNFGFVAVGEDGRWVTSDDGLSWTDQSTFTSEHLFAVHANGSVYVAVGGDGEIYYSTDAESWTAASASAASNQRDVLYSGAVYVTVGDDGEVLRSSNASSWNLASTPSSSHMLRSVAAVSPTHLIAVGVSGATPIVLHSTDAGWSWSSGTAPSTTEYLTSVGVDNGRILITGSNQSVWYSDDNGASWTSSGPSGTANLESLLFR